MLCIAANQTSLLIMLSIPGHLNHLADFVLQSFDAANSTVNLDIAFLTTFDQLFPLTQNGHWHLAQLHPNVTTRIYLELQGQQLNMAL